MILSQLECSTLAMIFFDDGGVVVSAKNTDDGLRVDGFPSTSFGDPFERLAYVDRIDNSNSDDEVDTAGVPLPRCGNTDFSGVRNMIECLYLPF